MPESIISLLKEVLPENDWMRVGLIVFLVFLVVLREKLFIFIGTVLRYLYRWILCRFGQHTWFKHSGVVDDNLITGRFIYVCDICRKTRIRDGIL